MLPVGDAPTRPDFVCTLTQLGPRLDALTTKCRRACSVDATKALHPRERSSWTALRVARKLP